jgi:hypothetical protein
MGENFQQRQEIGAFAFGAGAISLILGALILVQPLLYEMFARGPGICLRLGMLAFYLRPQRTLGFSIRSPLPHLDSILLDGNCPIRANESK